MRVAACHPREWARCATIRHQRQLPRAPIGHPTDNSVGGSTEVLDNQLVPRLLETLSCRLDIESADPYSDSFRESILFFSRDTLLLYHTLAAKMVHYFYNFNKRAGDLP